jgi:hypothetical protein
MGLESEISDSLQNMKPGKIRPLTKFYSAYTSPSNSLVPMKMTLEVMELPSITVLLVGNS